MMKKLILASLLVSMTVFAGTGKAAKEKNDVKRKTAAAGNCGDMEDGLNAANDLIRWTPEKLKGDMQNWYSNTATRTKAALLMAKLNGNPSMDAGARAEIQKEVEALCGVAVD